jgi:2-polyprenyl-3-methyl-5-hydroxy-6-metoxy-1,4-benzoquinol methylase
MPDFMVLDLHRKQETRVKRQHEVCFQSIYGSDETMFEKLEKISARPKPFEIYTAADLWTDEHTSGQMLSYHLNEDVDLSSRNRAFIEKSVGWINAYFNIGPGNKIADFGCGPGLYTQRLAALQADVTGIDFSERSIQYAKKVAAETDLSIRYINQDYFDFETDDRFDLILMIMCDFCALSPVQRKRILTKFHTLLTPGGHVLLDVYSLNAFEQREETVVYEKGLLNGFWSPEPYYGFLNTFKYEKEKVVLDKYSIIEANRTRTVYNWLQYFSREILEREFASCGFAIETLFSDVAGSAFNSKGPGIAVVARHT